MFFAGHVDFFVPETITQKKPKSSRILNAQIPWNPGVVKMVLKGSIQQLFLVY